MKPLRITGQFKKDLRLCKRRGYRMEKLEKLIDKLRKGEAMLPIDDDHPLTEGKWKGSRCCHPQGDWVLIYRFKDSELQLVRTGTHTDETSA
jgi:mRNA interferase YafQ